MFCIKCGAENSGEAEFCWKCGKSIFTAKSEEVPSADLAVNIDLPHFQQNSASPEFSAPHLIQNIAWAPRVQAESTAWARIAGLLLKMRLGDCSAARFVKTSCGCSRGDTNCRRS